ncbi:hypothetical protein F4X10_15525 [Candidatus Poribacteria bacterium]|nr:hypothetical protein [Candidatus Poribacteria bacterium]
MKIPKTLLFRVLNPITFMITFMVSLCVSWISFSALATLSDDPFIYGTLPDIIEAASILTAFTLIIGDIVADFAYEVYWIALPCALFISFWRAGCYVRGFTKENQSWTQWYLRQQETITQGNTLEELSASESMRTLRSVREAQSILLRPIQRLMFFVCHFSCWFSAFALLATILYPSNGIVEAVRYLVQSFPDIAILAAIHGSLSSYQGIRGNIKGTGIARQMWMEWHQRQQESKTLGYVLDEAPPLPEVVE